jgi:hypothetical protein
MKCLGCESPITAREAKLFSKKIVLCPKCNDKATVAQHRVRAIVRQVEATLETQLEQAILAGKLKIEDANVLVLDPMRTREENASTQNATQKE